MWTLDRSAPSNENSTEMHIASASPACLFSEAASVDGVEQAQRANGVHFSGVLGQLEAHLAISTADSNAVTSANATHLDVALRGEVVDFGGVNLADQLHKARAIGHVAIVQLERGCTSK